MPQRSPQKCWQSLIVTAIVVTGGVAQAQTTESGHNSRASTGVIDRIVPDSRWGNGLELSKGGLALSQKSIKDESFIIRDASDSPIPGVEANVDHRMSLGFRGIWSAETDLANPQESVSSSAEADEKIIYYTMRYDSIRLGLSYFPGTQRETDSSAASNAPSEQDSIALGANYDRRFDRIGVGVSAGYASTDAFSDLAIPDTDAWTVGARFDVGGLRVSGGVQLGGDSGDDVKLLAATGWDEAWNLGARYRWGRNDVSLAYAYGENRHDLEAPGDDKLDTATLSYARKLDGGVQWSINLFWADHDGKATGNAIDNDGTALSTAIRLSF